MRREIGVLVLACVGLFALFSCDNASPPGTDGETHFACSSDADCADHGVSGPCVGGVCAAATCFDDALEYEGAELTEALPGECDQATYERGSCEPLSREEKEYDRDGNLVLHRVLWKPDGAEEVGTQEEYEYDEAGRVIEERRYGGDASEGPPETTTYAYDAEGRVIMERRTEPDGERDAGTRLRVNQRAYTYEDGGKTIRITERTGVEVGGELVEPLELDPVIVQRLDEHDNVVFEGHDVDGDGSFEGELNHSYMYDGAGRVVRKEIQGGVTTENEYDTEGRLIRQWEEDCGFDSCSIETRRYFYRADGSLERQEVTHDGSGLAGGDYPFIVVTHYDAHENPLFAERYAGEERDSVMRRTNYYYDCHTE